MKLRLLFVGVCLSLVARSAEAVPITFTLGSSLLTTTPGATVTFTGTLTETGGSTTFLNGDSFNVTAPLIVNDTPFFLNFPLSLSPFQTFTASMFMVTVPAGTAPGLYPGTFAVLGGTASTATSVLASQSFAVSVTPSAVPEPTLGLMLLLGSSASYRARRRPVGR
jgi:hypothetical protein